MKVAFLITDGGPHSADKFAAATADKISGLIELLPNASQGTTLAKAKFEVAVLEIMMKAHNDAQLTERIGLHADGEKRLEGDLGVMKFVAAAVEGIVGATKGTPFAEHFALEHVRDVVTAEVTSDLTTAMQIERSWHVDGKHISRRTGKHEPRRGFDPNSPHRQAWIARHRPEAETA